MAAEESADSGAVEEDEVDEEPTHFVFAGGFRCQSLWSLTIRAVRSF